MNKLIAAAFALIVATTAHAIPVAPVQEPDSMITPVVAGCGAGGGELMVSAWLEPPNAKPADARDGMEALAHTITERQSQERLGIASNRSGPSF